MGQIWGQNYLFGNIINKHGHFEMQLDQYVYFHGLNKNKLEILSNFAIMETIWTKEGLNMGQICVKIIFLAKASPIWVILS